MNQRQRAFCEAYLVSGNATEAAKLAGYSVKTARSSGQRLLTFDDIRDYLEQRNEEINAENTATIEEVRRFWTETMRNPDAKQTDRLKASELLAKTLGAFVARVEVGDPIPVEVGNPILVDILSQLSDEELRALVRLGEDLE